MWPAGAEDPMGMGHGPAAPLSPRPSTTATAAHSASAAWQSPVPYLFGGLAAMLGLIALSLLALACSYWKLSGSILAAEEPHDDGDDDVQRRATGDGKAAAGGKKVDGEHWRDHVVVIMAGDERPTFLATPASGRGLDNDARGVAVVSVGCGGSSGSEDGEEERCVECGARSWPARAADDDGELSRSEQPSISGSSVISER